MISRSSVFMNYTPKPGRYDEVIGPHGQPHHHWEPLVRATRRAGRGAFSLRAQAIRRAVERDGVTYNIYGDPKGSDRPWEVDLLPFVIAKKEWQLLAQAVAQRARLLNK